MSPKNYFLRSNYGFSMQHALTTVHSAPERAHSGVRNMERQYEERKCKASKKKPPSACGVFKIKVNLIEVQLVYTMNVNWSCKIEEKKEQWTAF